MEVPVYGTKLTLALIKMKLKEDGFNGKAELEEITSDTVLSFQKQLYLSSEQIIAFQIH